MSQCQIICGCYYEHSDGKTPGHIISYPLHAAAPALLEALEEIIAQADGKGGVFVDALNAGRAAIAQAKGDYAQEAK